LSEKFSIDISQIHFAYRAQIFHLITQNLNNLWTTCGRECLVNKV